MSSIKFSHRYYKMPPGWESSKLLEVFDTDYTDLSQEFIEYDTLIRGGSNYPLSKGKHIVLLLQSSEGHIWTTVRRCTPEKRDYYRMVRGNIFRCEVMARKEKTLLQITSEMEANATGAVASHGGVA